MHTHEETSLRDTVDSDTESHLSTQSARTGSTIVEGGAHRFFGCYLLISESPDARSRNRTYIGFTVHPARRLRQHNGELKGSGAKRTGKHRPWTMAMVVHGFSCKNQALAFEWAWTNPHRTRTLASERGGGKFPSSPKGRIRALAALCAARPWRHCPLTLTVTKTPDVWTAMLNGGDPIEIPSSLRVDFRQISELGDLARYSFRPADAVPPRNIDEGCMVCQKDVGVNAQQSRTQCAHCGRLSCLICVAQFVTPDGDDGEDRIVPDEVFCFKCHKTMKWDLVLRLSRALEAESKIAYDLSVATGGT